MRELLEPTVDDLGYELVWIEMANQDKHKILRIYIDAPGGIQVDDCATVSRQLSALLDVEDPMNTEYFLEVSSPGLDRPLVKPEHFKQFLGEQARIMMHVHVLGRRKFKGLMVEANDNTVVVEMDGESFELPYKDMDSARLDPVF
jgi:ribosome maturation factor RimP